MKLYDKLIGQIKNLLPENAKRFSYSEPTLKIKKDNSILLLKETAYELGGSQKPCVSTVAVSDSIKFDNCTYLYGKDIPEIRSDCCFGKIVFLEIKDIGEGVAYLRIAKAVKAIHIAEVEKIYFRDQQGIWLEAKVPRYILNAQDFPEHIEQLVI
mgnify:CR=1 FL=1